MAEALSVATGHADSAFFGAFAEAARPKLRKTVTQWADTHRRLSTKGSSEAGIWRTSRTPYLREIQDCLSWWSPVRRVVFVKPAQIGGTEVGLNWIGYCIAEGPPAPMLVVVPTLEVRKRWVMQRLDPLLTETDVLADIFDSKKRRDASNAEDMKEFPGGVLVLGGANSAASLASMPIKNVLCDEVDRFPWEVGNEGDPLGLIDKRTATFPWRKVFLVSTPTVKDASRIDEEYQASDRRRYHVPCPDCGELQHLKWANLRWTADVSEAWYLCEHCGTEIGEHHKPRMLAAGRWIPENPESPVHGYHLNGLYAPLGLGFRWVELARDWRAAQGDPIKLKRFVNTSLGEVWEDRKRDIKPASLRERAEPYRLRTPPRGCLLLTAGVDVQDNRLAVQILGWGRDGAWWVIDWVELPGDPGKPEVWQLLVELLNRPMQNWAGRDMRIKATAIDTGGHHTHDVYMFVRERKVPRPMAIKGSNTPNRPILAPRPTAQDITWRGKVLKGGVQLWLIGTDTGKDVLSNRLTGDAGVEPSGRRCHFSEDLEEDFYSQLVSEVFDPEKNKWVKRRGRRNEALDTWVYAFAATHHPEVRMHSMRKRQWDELQLQLEGTLQVEAAPAKDSPGATPELPVTPTAPTAPKPTAKPKPKRASGFVNRW